jgi:hypothetical protein
MERYGSNLTPQNYLWCGLPIYNFIESNNRKVDKTKQLKVQKAVKELLISIC